MFVHESGGSPIKIWMKEQEFYSDPEMVKQIEQTSRLPFIFDHVSLMPDGHVGFSCPIGTVAATKGVILPGLVGVDIGCGMMATKTSETDIELETLKNILGDIRNEIPVGFKHRETAVSEDRMPNMVEVDDKEWDYPVVKGYKDSILQLRNIESQYDSARKQLGTLGGGNHFLEGQRGSDGHIWYMIHSGSRNIGKQIADYYIKISKYYSEKFGYNIPKEWKLDGFPVDSEIGQSYLREMNFALEFAYLNRKMMSNCIFEIMQRYIPGINIIETFNIHHNYANEEEHMGEKVWVHRKGATQAKSNQTGIIPGSQGTKSYIVRGKGNIESYESCSHGSGRLMGRNEARKRLNFEEQAQFLNDKGILHALRGESDLDEAPGAYKDIESVMSNQSDLVDVSVELIPLAVVKG